MEMTIDNTKGISLGEFIDTQERIKQAIERVERLTALKKRLEVVSTILFEEVRDLGFDVDEPDCYSNYPMVQWQLENLDCKIDSEISDWKKLPQRKYAPFSTSFFGDFDND